MKAPAGGIYAAIEILRARGVSFGAMIDVGCADGDVILRVLAAELLEPATMGLNIDANEIYVPSLRYLKEKAGIDYAVCAVADHDGEIEITRSQHSYWDSVHPPGDRYWTELNDMTMAAVTVPCKRLDSLVIEHALKPPYLLKLDVQGAERLALAGAPACLQQTNAVIIEADLSEFQALNYALEQAGFQLFDATELKRLADHSLGWFYPVYVKAALGLVGGRAMWPAEHNTQMLLAQAQRRQAVQAEMKAMMETLLSARAAR